jgi:hypothetical protein
MKFKSIENMVDQYCEGSSHFHPIALRLDRSSEKALLDLFPDLQGFPQKVQRKGIEEYFKKVKPSNIEIFIWDQEITEVCFPVSSEEVSLKIHV